LTTDSDLPADPESPGDLRRTMRLVTLGWVFGSVWLTMVSGAPIAIFARQLDASEFQFGLLTAMPFLASLMSMPASVLIERTGQRKAIFLISLFAQRFLWFAIATVPVWIIISGGESWVGTATVIFLVLAFFMHAGVAVGGPAWVSWMADIIPERVRGKYFARRRQWGVLSAIPAAYIVGWVMDHFAHGDGHPDRVGILIVCGVIFSIAAVFGIVDIALFLPVKEPHRAPAEKAPLHTIFASPLRDRQFLIFAGFVGTMTFAISFMGQFVTLYMIERLQISAKATQLMLLIAPLVATFLVLGHWGRAVDRMGKKPVMAIAGLGLVPVGLGWIFVNPASPWLGYVLSAAGAALWAGVEVANFNFVLEFSGSEESETGVRGGSNFVAVNGAIINVAGCLGGLAAGLIAQLLREWQWQPTIRFLPTMTFYELLFIISGILRLLAVVIFLPLIHEPQARPARETLVYMTTNIYNNMVSATLQPLRLARLMKKATYRDE